MKQLANSMEQVPSSEANSYSSTYLPIYFLKTHCDIVFHLRQGLSSDLFPLDFCCLGRSKESIEFPGPI
jgi:hypothetical protein